MHPDHRRAGGGAHRLHAHSELRAARPEPAAGRAGNACALKESFPEHRRLIRQSNGGVLGTIPEVSALARVPRGARAEVPGGLGFRRALRSGRRVQRHHDQPAGQRDGRRFRAPTDPRHRRGPGDGGGALARHLPVRRAAQLPRHGLLRDVQSPERDAGEPSQGTHRRGHRRWRQHQRKRLSARHSGARDRVRRRHRTAAGHGHSRDATTCLSVRPGPTVPSPISASRSRASRTSSPSPGRAAPQC